MCERKGHPVEWPSKLLFFAHAFKRLVISLLIYELAGICIPLSPAIILGIIGLGPITYRAVPVTITFWWIGGHAFLLLSPASLDAQRFCRA
jgi:hypothetical protein